MEKVKPETTEQRFDRLSFAALTLTQDQIEACAWAMDGSGAGWTKEGIHAVIKNDKRYVES